jgi:hypothetical protein
MADKLVGVSGEVNITGNVGGKEASIDVLSKVTSLEAQIKALQEQLAKVSEDTEVAGQALKLASQVAAQVAASRAPPAPSSRSFRPVVQQSRATLQETDDEVAATVISSLTVPELETTAILNKGTADLLYTKVGHTHTYQNTEPQKDALDATPDLGPTNRVLGFNDMADSRQLTSQFWTSYDRHNNIPTTHDQYINVTPLLDGEDISDGLNAKGYILGARAHIRDRLTQLPIVSGSWVLFGVLRQQLTVLLRSPPESNRANFNFDFNAGQLSYVIDQPGLLTKSNYMVIGSNNRATITKAIDINRAGIWLNPQGTHPQPVTTSDYLYRVDPLQLWVLERSGGEWENGSFGGTAVCLQSTHGLFPGDAVYLNPGGATEELKTVDTIVPAGPEDTDGVVIAFVEPLIFDHDGGETMTKDSITVDVNTLIEHFLDTFFLNGPTVSRPGSPLGRNVDLLIPRRWQLGQFPTNTLEIVTEFFHLAEEADVGEDFVLVFGFGFFAPDGFSSYEHDQFLTDHWIAVEPIWHAKLTTVGNYAIRSVTEFNFTEAHTGGVEENNQPQFQYVAVPTETPTTAPMVATGIGTLSSLGTPALIEHDENIPVEFQFIHVEFIDDEALSSVGPWGIDGLLPSSFTVRHTGSNSTTQFRWSVYDARGIPRGRFYDKGQATFAGYQSQATLQHQLNADRYVVLITPRWGPNIAGVGVFGVANRGQGSVEVVNSGSDDTTSFDFAIIELP